MNDLYLTRTPAQAKLYADISEAEDAMLGKVSEVIREAREKVAVAFAASGLEGEPPDGNYFASVLQQAMYCALCGADRKTFDGGNPEIAVRIIRNNQNVAKRYWGAEIEPYPR